MCDLPNDYDGKDNEAAKKYEASRGRLSDGNFLHAVLHLLRRRPEDYAAVKT
jgi:hypothetical protein